MMLCKRPLKRGSNSFLKKEAALSRAQAVWKKRARKVNV
jgi:hypothetical protein